MRTFVPAVLTGLFAALSGVSPASAAAVFVEINPSTARAGDEIALRASCDDNLKAATVTGEPIGSVTVNPEFGFLTATVRVPAGTGSGDYPVLLKCPDGGTATGTLHVVAKVEPSRGPATGGGGTAPGAAGPLLISGGLAAVLAGLALGAVSLRRRVG
ncbi:hypothetical protein [Actinoplanes couchii]|uniref:Gram-positive cocci surface proteins LPxTG domain-containing protein n=1 Tax=Actinoplanes couchii TaxID=403638 RepID=A0ABQ3XAU4_9ACTN|nr:hypothetical protein [Actinoplanes couchii]MDR6323119.1 hypothetical protein [Actinoplanes couchii]GID55633.1 hypothetical protein Aco03nite_040370 [Actinoplanes couchii]